VPCKPSGGKVGSSAFPADLGFPSERFAQILASLPGYPVPIDIDRHCDAVVTQLLLNIRRAVVIHEEQRRIRMPQIVGTAGPQLTDTRQNSTARRPQKRVIRRMTILS